MMYSNSRYLIHSVYYGTWFLLLTVMTPACNKSPSPAPQSLTVSTQQAPLSTAPETLPTPVLPRLQDGEAPTSPATSNSPPAVQPSTSPPADLVWLNHPTLPFAITATEITVLQFKLCVVAGKCGSEHRKPCNFGTEGKENHPINCVNYHGAEEFCHFANARICTESEWLAACAGGEGRAFPYGNVFDISACNHQSNVDATANQPKDTAPVKSFSQCEGGLPGLFDMAGNVTEWVNGCKDDYCKFRGGGFVNNDPVDRFTGCSGVCSGNKKTFSSPTIGIRCCRDVVSSPQ